jgi:nucleoside-diphosphate-sugar epimerase
MGGHAWRPHVHCRDAAQAFLLAAEAPAERVTGEIFNVGADSNNFTISEIAVMVANEVPNTKIEYVETVEDPRSYRVAFEKIKHVLGFAPRYRVEDGIREVRGLVERGEIDGEDEHYSNLKYLTMHGFRRPRPELAIDIANVRESVAS